MAQNYFDNSSALPADEFFFDFAPHTFRHKLLDWYSVNKRPLPWRNYFLKFKNPYHVWISEIMLQQTMIKAVIPAYERFLKQFPDVYTLAAGHEDDVRKASRGLGYYRRFHNLHKAAQLLCDLYPKAKDLKWPSTHAEWQELPGIGDYTAAAISSIAFNFPAAVVDGNVERVLCRIFDVRLPPNLPKLKKLFKRFLLHVLCSEHPGDFNQGMMELGQVVCTKTSPQCDSCPLQRFCAAFAHKSQGLAPQAKEKTPKVNVHLGLTIFGDRGKFALVKRDGATKFLKNSWGFFTDLNPNPMHPPLGTIRHNITHHKITADVSYKNKISNLSSLELRWLDKHQVEENLIANLDRKAWHLFLKHEKRPGTKS